MHKRYGIDLIPDSPEQIKENIRKAGLRGMLDSTFKDAIIKVRDGPQRLSKLSANKTSGLNSTDENYPR